LYWGEPSGSPLYYRRHNMTVEKLGISEINKHEGYATATKAGNTVWNARSTQKVYREEDKVDILEQKVDAMQDTLEKILKVVA
jgi:hypothetical protein|tara:strand:- start:1891 stop:2139 length:249 start_codon:yes stop_codon:yes gene_type:complete